MNTQQLEQRIGQIDAFLNSWQSWSDRNFGELQTALITIAKLLFQIASIIVILLFNYGRKVYQYWSVKENRQNVKNKAVEVYETAKRFVIAVCARIASVASFVVGYALQVYDR